MFYIIISIILILLYFYISHVKISTTSNISDASDQPMRPINQRRKMLELRDKRRQRHNTIWGVLRFIKIMKQFESDCNSIYDLKKHSEDFAIAKEYLNSHIPSAADIETAIRFCQISYTQNKCLHQLNKQDIDQIYSYQSYPGCDEVTIQSTIEREKEYWDKVICGYKRKSAKENRIIYCIEYFSKIKSMPIVMHLESITIKLDEIINNYKQQLESIEKP